MTIQTAANKTNKNILEEIHWRGMISGASGYHHTRLAIDWYREFIKNNVRHANVFKAVKAKNKKNRMVLGRMYIFKYYAKYNATLPYWDAMPLIFPFKEDQDHIWGINFHYLPPAWRVVAMRSLYKLLNNNKMDERTKLNLTYARLQRLQMSGIFQPAIKCYLKSNFKSYFIEVEPIHWPIAVFLPIAKWQNSPSQAVYKDFRKKTGLR